MIAPVSARTMDPDLCPGALSFSAVGLRTRLGDPLDESVSASASCFAATPSNEVILVCGFWDKSFKCFDADTGRSSISLSLPGLPSLLPFPSLPPSLPLSNF